MSRPLHHDLRRNAKGKGVTDKGATTCVRTEQSIFRSHFIDALISLVVGLTDRFIDPSKFGKLLDIDSDRLSGFSEEVTRPAQEQIAELLAPRFSRGHPLRPLRSLTSPLSPSKSPTAREDKILSTAWRGLRRDKP